MATKSDVEQLLRDFKIKLSVWGLEFHSREKNDETLLFLEIYYAYVKKVLESLDSVDYCEGPVEEKISMGSPMWVFGRDVKGHEIYIKISLGKPNQKAQCFSFHFPAYPMQYPLKI
ncbi:hypothetical protein [Spirosoma areae]